MSDTPKTLSLKEKIGVMQADLDGKPIQIWENNSKSWMTMLNGILNYNWEENHYRIKPSQKVLWVNEYPCESFAAHDSREAAIDGQTARAIRVAVKYVEEI
jgi:hypothetical protein